LLFLFKFVTQKSFSVKPQ